MIRPPSNQKKYDTFFSLDPALKPLPTDPTEEQRAERERLIELAREAGPAQWTELIVPGECVTVFTMRPLPSEAFGDLLAAMVNGESKFKVYSLAFRIALLDAKPLPDDVKVEHVEHPSYGRVATLSFLEKAGITGEMGAAICVELGKLAYERARNVSPKS